ncbi:apoptosis-associated speck-like protein containing a CARD [Carassius gibelio]|uniref:apoptosis-associated speck-like protein containing a CARD n=1 Tax=Carassius gibelio TaxID=101364 RepID=UPI0022796F8F|nr:apoptosis-associated speck-like protein containing a CARD [Carassius gibelio]
MSENNEGEQQERCEEAKFVDKNYSYLIQNVTTVMPIADELLNKGMIHNETYEQIKAETTDQEKMRKLLKSLKPDNVKSTFYYLLEKHAKHHFKNLGGVSRKRKLADPECSIPFKRLNTKTTEQDITNYNNASNSAPPPRPASTNIVTNIICGMPPAPKKECKKSPALKKEKQTLAPEKADKPPAPKKAEKLPAPKKAEKLPAPKKAKKPPAPKKAKKPPAPKKAKKPPAPKKAKKPPAPKKAKKPPAPKKAKKPPAPKKAKKPPAPKKAKKPPAPKKAKKPPAPKKAK